GGIAGGGFAGGGSIGGAGNFAGGSAGKPQEPLTPVPGTVPSIHRLRWGWIIGTTRVTANSVTFEKKLELVVAPIFGPSATPPAFSQEPAHLTLFDTGADPKSGRWSSSPIGTAPVIHAIEVVKRDDNTRSVVLAASNLGVTEFGVGS